MKNRWEKLLNPLRYTKDGPKVAPEDFRGPFAIDQDRILFTSSFRRLSKKTQVHPLTRNDHIHNRLTHSMEVACVARTLAVHVGNFLKENDHLPLGVEPYNIGEIVYAACLVHDIGNPPFGHAGESAIQDWFADPVNNRYVEQLDPMEKADFQSFDGNAQGLRVVTALENNKDRGGLRLTFPTIAAFVKYPRSAHAAQVEKKKKFNYYQAEEKMFDEIFSELGLKNGSVYLRHPLAYLTEAADDICYRIIDMEDARELKIITYNDFRNVIEPIYAELDVQEERLRAMDSDRRRMSMLRTLVIGKMITSTVQAFKNNYDKVISGEIFSLVDDCDQAAVQYMDSAKEIFNKKIMHEAQKISLEIGSYSLYKILLDAFIPATFNKIKSNPLSYKESRALDLMGVNAPSQDDDLYRAYLRVIDFVTGMTDFYATFLSRQFSGTGGGQ